MIYALGAFDGFHLGHKRLLVRAEEDARRCGTDWGVMTFDGHPRALLQGGGFKLLFTQREKDMLASYLGIPRMEKIKFTMDFAGLSPADFAEFISHAYPVEGLVIGENFRFGKDRAGTPDMLRDICAERGWSVAVIPRVEICGKTVSSTGTRAAVASGDMAGVSCMLGYPFVISGRVERGDMRGRTIGFPTANIPACEGKIYPCDGVYGALTLLDGEWYPVALNIGANPTFKGERKTRCEAHIMGADGDLYGRELTFFLTEKVRGEIKFPDKEMLAEQIKKDVEFCTVSAAEYLKKHMGEFEKFKAVL